MSTALVNIIPVTSLPVDAAPNGAEAILLYQGGVAKQAVLATIVDGLPVATEAAKGLLAAVDKATLDGLVTEVTNILNPPSVTVASTSTINVPAGYFFVILTGTTTITNITGLVTNALYEFYYPAGAGLTFMGNPVQAGDAPLVVMGTAS